MHGLNTGADHTTLPVDSECDIEMTPINNFNDRVVINLNKGLYCNGIQSRGMLLETFSSELPPVLYRSTKLLSPVPPSIESNGLIDLCSVDNASKVVINACSQQKSEKPQTWRMQSDNASTTTIDDCDMLSSTTVKYVEHSTPIPSQQTQLLSTKIWNKTIQHKFNNIQNQGLRLPPDITRTTNNNKVSYITQNTTHKTRYHSKPMIKSKKHAQTNNISIQGNNKYQKITKNRGNHQYHNHSTSMGNNTGQGNNIHTEKPSKLHPPLSKYNNILIQPKIPNIPYNNIKKLKLNKEWATFFSHALQPKIKSPNDVAIQVPNIKRQQLLTPNIDQTQHIGGEFSKDHNAIRMWNVNANTILTHNDYSELHELCLSIIDYNINIVGFQEINLNLLNPKIRDAITKVFKQYFTVKIIFSTTPIQSPSDWKPGGTMLVILGKLTHSITNTSSDSMGRWCRATIELADNKQFIIYSSYNVIDTSIATAGPNTIFFQQWKLLRLNGILIPNPRKQMIADLHHDITKYRKENDYLCIMGDLNEELGKDPTLMASICSHHKLYDVLPYMYPADSTVPTYIRGNKRLDYFLLSHNSPQPIDVGYNQYHMLYSSDHRAGFMDIPLYHHQNTKHIIQNSLREIHSDSHKVGEFIDNIYTHLLHNNVFHKHQVFQLTIKENSQPWIEANKIDHQLDRAIKQAQTWCLKKSRPPWSEVLHHASITLRYWKIVESENSNKTVYIEAKEKIRETLPSLPLTIPNITSVRKNIKASRKKLRLIRVDAVKHRQAFLHELKERIALRKTSSLLSSEKSIIIIDKLIKSNGVHANIRKVLSPYSQQMLTKVKIIKETVHLNPSTGETIYIDPQSNKQSKTPTFVTIDSKQELEKAILNRNKKHCAQAKHTPWNTFPLNQIGSSNNYNPFVNANKEEIQLPPKSFIETKLILELLRDEDKLRYPKWSPKISFDDFISGFIHWKEKTSTSPSNRHLGVYIAIATAYIDSGGEFSETYDDNNQSIKNKAEEILIIMHGLCDAALQKGFYLHRWKSVVEIMIYKKPGNIELESLRIINLFEADFNLLIGIVFGRRAMSYQSKNKIIHKDQYGRPGGECPDVAFTKILHYHMSHYTKTALGSFESDAASCFDRIVMSLAFICYRIWGTDPLPIQMWEKTLYNIEHHVKTGFGTTRKYNKYSAENPIIGPGQGAKSAGAACTIITTPMLRIYDKLAHGLQFCDPTQQLEYVNKAKMFVDDTSKYMNNFKQWLQAPPTAEQVADLIQHDAQIWERCLWTTGGLLKLPKCLYYSMIWEFDNKGIATLTPASKLPSITLTSGDSNTTTTITQYDCTKTHKTVGHHFSPTLDSKDALTKLKTTASFFSTQIMTSFLSRYETWIAYFSVFLPRMIYTFACTAYTKKNLIHCLEVQLQQSFLNWDTIYITPTQ